MKVKLTSKFIVLVEDGMVKVRYLAPTKKYEAYFAEWGRPTVYITKNANSNNNKGE
jgi:hypothetical protein